jgi:hypothetical protein
MFNGDSETHSPGVAKPLITFFRPLYSFPVDAQSSIRGPSFFGSQTFFEGATEGAALGGSAPRMGSPFVRVD